jgi:hypothetical protein
VKPTAARPAPAADDLADGLRLGPVAAQELQPRGRGEEQVAQFDHRAARQRGGRTGPDRPPATPAICGASPSAREVMVSRPTAPSEGSASPRKPKLRMSSRSDPSILDVAWRDRASGRSSGRHAAAVIGHPDQRLAAIGIIHRDPPRPGIQRVLHQFLDRRGRAFHHLARRDAVDRGLVQLPDHRARWRISWGGSGHATSGSRTARVGQG